MFTGRLHVMQVTNFLLYILRVWILADFRARTTWIFISLVTLAWNVFERHFPFVSSCVVPILPASVCIWTFSGTRVQLTQSPLSRFLKTDLSCWSPCLKSCGFTLLCLKLAFFTITSSIIPLLIIDGGLRQGTFVEAAIRTSSAPLQCGCGRSSSSLFGTPIPRWARHNTEN